MEVKISIGTPAETLASNTITVFKWQNEVRDSCKRREENGKFMKLTGATGNNLKNVSIDLPLGQLICVTGVSGKSTLINETLYPILNAYYFNGVKSHNLIKKIEGLEHIDKVIDIDQSPIGRTPRSNPATYTEVLLKYENYLP
jgi:excinuclease ABC subunit A